MFFGMGVFRGEFVLNFSYGLQKVPFGHADFLLKSKTNSPVQRFYIPKNTVKTISHI